MNRNLLMPVAVSLILLSGCKYKDDNFEGLDDMTPVSYTHLRAHET